VPTASEFADQLCASDQGGRGQRLAVVTIIRRFAKHAKEWAPNAAR